MVRFRASRTGRSALTTVALTSSSTGGESMTGKCKGQRAKCKVSAKCKASGYVPLCTFHLLCTFHFALSTSCPSRGQGLAARLFGEREQRQADQKRDRGDRDRNAETAVGLDRRADREYHR